MKKRNCLVLVILLVLIMPAGTLACFRDPKILEWLERNGDIEEGKITLTKYPGGYETIASVEWRIQHEGIVYTSWFKGGIAVFDRVVPFCFALTPPKWSSFTLPSTATLSKLDLTFKITQIEYDLGVKFR